MRMFETALGRLVPENEAQTVLEDSILSLLYNFRLNPQNPNNEPMNLSTIVYAVTTDRRYVEAALDALMEQKPPLVEQVGGSSLAHRILRPAEPTFRITGAGVRFVRNMPYGLASVL